METLRFKEAQVRALEELEEKHRLHGEEAQQEKEEEKQLLVTVGQMHPTPNNKYPRKLLNE